MTNEQNFLIKYGIHNFVACTIAHGKRIFTIKARTDQTLIDHAKYLIKNAFGDNTQIRVV